MGKPGGTEFTDSGIGLEYAILYKEPGHNESRRRDAFDARADGTGYVSFYCGLCGAKARTVRLSLFRETEEDAGDGERIMVLRFALRCPKCRSKGVMRIMVNDPLEGPLEDARHASEWPEPVPP